MADTKSRFKSAIIALLVLVFLSTWVYQIIEIREIKETVNAIDLSGIEMEISDLKREVRNIDGTSAETDLTTLENGVSNIESEVSSLDSKVSDAQYDIDKIKRHLNE